MAPALRDWKHPQTHMSLREKQAAGVSQDEFVPGSSASVQPGETGPAGLGEARAGVPSSESLSICPCRESPGAAHRAPQLPAQARRPLRGPGPGHHQRPAGAPAAAAAGLELGRLLPLGPSRYACCSHCCSQAEAQAPPTASLPYSYLLHPLPTGPGVPSATLPSALLPLGEGLGKAALQAEPPQAAGHRRLF